MRHFLCGLLLIASTAFTGCATACLEFVEAQPGYSITQGRVLRIDGLVSESMTRLADGIAFNVSGKACRVAVMFDNGKKSVLELERPDILVCGAKKDYILQPARDSGPGGPTGKATGQDTGATKMKN